MRNDLWDTYERREAAPAGPANVHLLGLFLILNLADVLLTHLNVSLGFGTEENQLFRLVIERFGWAFIYWFKVVGPILVTLVILNSPGCRLLASRQFSLFLALACLLSLTGVCSGVWVSSANLIS